MPALSSLPAGAAGTREGLPWEQGRAVGGCRCETAREIVGGQRGRKAGVTSLSDLEISGRGLWKTSFLLFRGLLKSLIHFWQSVIDFKV